MRLVIRFLGLDLLDVDLTTDAAEEDTARDLSGGNLGSECIEGDGDLYLGFTNGREGDGS
jgi:hypothetical protein